LITLLSKFKTRSTFNIFVLLYISYSGIHVVAIENVRACHCM